VIRIAPRTYVDEQGRYHARFPVNGRYTWKLLDDCKTKREAIAAAQSATAPVRAESFPAIVKLWIAAGCITKKQKWRQPGENFQYESKLHAARLVEYFGNQHIDQVNDLFRCAEYQTWAGKKYGTRAADKGAQTLSNVINYALFRLKVVKLNFVRSNRDNVHVVKSPSRNRMPESAAVIHQLADYFLNAADGRSLRSEVFAWLTLYQMFTGCRTSELLRLRLDACPGGSGYIAAGQLHLGHRSKGGIDPWVNIGPEFAQMIDCFKLWHRTRFPNFAWYFCGPFGNVLDDTAHVHALTRACKKLKLPHITPHGLRAYYVTKRRRDGINDNVVAGEIGDKTVSLIAVTYGRNTGGDKLSFTPAQGLPSWLRWQPEQNKIARIA
jgi:integrase